MTAEELLIYPSHPEFEKSSGSALSDTASLPQVIDRLIGENAASVDVHTTEGVQPLTAWQALQPLGRMLHHDEECSEIEVCCATRDYSASALTHAAEDADAPVVSLLAYPGEPGMLCVYMRVNRSDPSHAVRSLERHGFNVTRAAGPEYADEELSRERMEELQHYLNI